MPLFEYKGVKRGGKSVAGEIAAEHDRQARALLRESGVTPVSMKMKADSDRRKVPSLSAMAAMVRQLGTLISAGFPVDRALYSLAMASSDHAMKTVLNSLHEGVTKGQKLSDAVMTRMSSGGRNSNWDEFGAMLQAGEASGELAEVLIGYADLLERRVEFRRKLQGALFYPLVVLLLALAVVAFLFSYVVPTITLLFEDSKMRLPLATRILFFVAELFKTGFFPAMAVLIVGTVLGRGYLASRRGRRRMEKMVYALPGIGALLEKAAFARWSRTFGALLGKGVEIRSAMRIAARTARSTRIEDAIEVAEPKVAGGVTLANALHDTGVFPPIAVEAVTLGESSGTLPKLLTEMATAWESEVSARAARFADVLEPLVLVVMGGIVGAIVLAILLPIFEFNSAVK